MVKVVITDLDDTLLRHDKTVSEFTIKTIILCREKGIKTIVATARSAYAKQFVPFELFDGFVLMNGATAVAENNKFYERIIMPEQFIPFLNKMSENKIQAAAEIDGIHYSNFEVPNRKHKIINFDTLKEKSEKIYAVVDTIEKANTVKQFLPEDLSAYFTKDNYALITHKEASKINAISAILEHWNISLDEAVAFGDDINDIEMLKKCGTGVAMENAHDEAKAVADAICGDCNNDGVAVWLAKNVLCCC